MQKQHKKQSQQLIQILSCIWQLRAMLIDQLKVQEHLLKVI